MKQAQGLFQAGQVWPTAQTEETVTLDMWAPKTNEPVRPKDAMVPSGMTPPDRATT